jgi:ethylbenzene dioxygenase subunit beta
MTPGQPVVGDALDGINAFLHYEARLLDGRRYREWLGLMADDVRYVMPSVDNRYHRDGQAPGARMAFFDDRLIDLDRRVQRFECESAWPEDPATRHVHLISNIEAYEHPEGYEVHSVFMNYRSRGDHDEMVLVGRREDVLRQQAGGLRIARRLIHSGQSLLAARNLNTFL